MSHARAQKVAPTPSPSAATAAPALRQDLSGREKLAAFIRLGRPKFLLYSLLLFGLGGAIAAHGGATIDLRWYVTGQLFVWAVHLMTHYCNEYFDLPADLANRSPTGWTGGSRVLVEGSLSPVVSLGAAFAFLFVALAFMVAMPTAGARAAALTIIVLAWFYTAPPFQFNYMGLGELTVATVLNLFFPLLGCYLQVREVPGLLLLVCVPIMFVQHARMMIMNLADHDGDARIGKRTCAVVLGPRRTVLAFAVEQVVAYGLVFAFTRLGHVPRAAGIGFLLTAPIALWQTLRLRDGAIHDPRRSNSVVFWASTHVALAICGPIVGLIVDASLDPTTGRFLVQPPFYLPTIVVAVFGAFLCRQVWQNRELPGRASQTAAPASKPASTSTATEPATAATPEPNTLEAAALEAAALEAAAPATLETAALEAASEPAMASEPATDPTAEPTAAAAAAEPIAPAAAAPPPSDAEAIEAAAPDAEASTPEAEAAAPEAEATASDVEAAAPTLPGGRDGDGATPPTEAVARESAPPPTPAIRSAVVPIGTAAGGERDLLFGVAEAQDASVFAASIARASEYANTIAVRSVGGMWIAFRAHDDAGCTHCGRASTVETLKPPSSRPSATVARFTPTATLRPLSFRPGRGRIRPASARTNAAPWGNAK